MAIKLKDVCWSDTPTVEDLEKYSNIVSNNKSRSFDDNLVKTSKVMLVYIKHLKKVRITDYCLECRAKFTSKQVDKLAVNKGRYNKFYRTTEIEIVDKKTRELHFEQNLRLNSNLKYNNYYVVNGKVVENIRYPDSKKDGKEYRPVNYEKFLELNSQKDKRNRDKKVSNIFSRDVFKEWDIKEIKDNELFKNEKFGNGKKINLDIKHKEYKRYNKMNHSKQKFKYALYVSNRGNKTMKLLELIIATDSQVRERARELNKTVKKKEKIIFEKVLFDDVEPLGINRGVKAKQVFNEESFIDWDSIK